MCECCRSNRTRRHTIYLHVQRHSALRTTAAAAKVKSRFTCVYRRVASDSPSAVDCLLGCRLVNVKFSREAKARARLAYVSLRSQLKSNCPKRVTFSSPVGLRLFKSHKTARYGNLKRKTSNIFF